MVRLARSVAVTGIFAMALAVAGFVGSSPTRAATDTSVSIVDFGFSDATITVEAGSTVTWTNTGAVTHTVTADDGEFDSGDLAPGDTFSLTFDTPGTFGYFCEIHPDMIGTVIVTEASDGGATTDDTADLPATGSGPQAPDNAGALYVLLLSVAVFAGATMFRRATKR